MHDDKELHEKLGVLSEIKGVMDKRLMGKLHPDKMKEYSSPAHEGSPAEEKNELPEEEKREIDAGLEIGNGHHDIAGDNKSVMASHEESREHDSVLAPEDEEQLKDYYSKLHHKG